MEKKIKRKIAERDFLEENLPQTRKEQFKDILKINFWTFFKIGFILLGAFFLVLVKIFFTYYFNASVNNSYILGHISEAERNGLMIYILLISGGINIVLYPPIFIVIAGILRIIRQLCYTDGVIFFYDFKTGVKDNWKKFLLIGLFFAFIEMIDITMFSLFGFNIITIIVFTLSVLVLFPMLIGATYFFSTYENKFVRGLINALLINLRASWRPVVITVAIVVPVLLLEFLMNLIIFKLLIYLILIIIGLPILLLLGYELYLTIYDEHVNIYHFPETIRKGLYVSQSEKEEIQKKLDSLKGEQQK